MFSMLSDFVFPVFLSALKIGLPFTILFWAVNFISSVLIRAFTTGTISLSE